MKKIQIRSHHPVTVENCCPKLPFAESKLKRFIAELLSHLKKRGYGVSVYIIDSRRMKALHYKYFNDSSDTDCISFSQYEGRACGVPGLLGDVFVCWNQIKRQASQFGNTPDAELLYCMIHDILHLLGYDDLTPRKKKKMFKMQDRLFRKISPHYLKIDRK